MIADAESIVASALTNQTFPVEQGPERPEPDAAVFVYDIGGQAPIIEHNTGDTTRIASLTVLVRGDRDDYETTHQEARQAWSDLDGASPSGSLILELPISSPAPLGQDDEGRWRMAITVYAYIDES